MPLVFTDPKSLRHLITQDVCSTRKSHTSQEVQYDFAFIAGECEDKLLLKRESFLGCLSERFWLAAVHLDQFPFLPVK